MSEPENGGNNAVWWSGLWDLSGEDEPLPLPLFVIPIWIPCCCAAAALGMALRRAGERRGPARRQRAR
jgi:hypothetical protein